MTLWVCVDANVILKLYLPEDLSETADTFWNNHHALRYHFAAPSLALYEVAAVLRQNAYRRNITSDEAVQALHKALNLPIQYLEPHNLHVRAYEFAVSLDLPTTYDANYLVVAQELGCEFWTADRRLANIASKMFPWARWLGDYSPTTA